MIKRYCDICGTEIHPVSELRYRDSETAFHKLVKTYEDGETRYEIDICNGCLKKVIKLANGNLHIFEEHVNACKDCKHYINHDKRCGFLNHGMETYDYCSYGERKKR